MDPESVRLLEDRLRLKHWKRWGPYLSERQWSTVREDYSPDADVWRSVPHEHARSRAYRWGEDGLLGITDSRCRLCFSVALWNEKDPILKERLFGLTGTEGNHGEDVKEAYYYLDATPTHSYLKALYRYPQQAFPYAALVDGNRARGLHEPELELRDLGVWQDDRFFDVVAEYAKADVNDLLIRISVTNHGRDRAPLHVLPTLWFRNTWAWGRTGDSYWREPRLEADGVRAVRATHENLGEFRLWFRPESRATPLYTYNETNTQRLFGAPPLRPFVKDAFHRWLIDGDETAVNPEPVGTKFALHERFEIAPGETVTIDLRLGQGRHDDPFADFSAIFDLRRDEADGFYALRLPGGLDDEGRAVVRQAYAGLVWTKQFYHYIVEHWIDGDAPAQPPPPEERQSRNRDWGHLYNRDILSMPDKWEYPWFAAWDLAFHMVPFARIDPDFAKQQLILLLREWYMHPNGQIPAYEFAFSDVNPPVHAWAAWRIYKIAAKKGERDRTFLAQVFQKLLLNFTWWVNRKDRSGNNLFSGGFLGLDNIGVFDRSQLPPGTELEQADGTAWMAFFASTMLVIALELACEDEAYEDMASKFFEHFVRIVHATNTAGGMGLWDDDDGFYYDLLDHHGHREFIRVRSLVGLVPLFAVQVIDDEVLDKVPGFRRRMEWFLENNAELGRHTAYRANAHGDRGHRLLAVVPREKLERLLPLLLDESEFLSPYGVRSMSRCHLEQPVRVLLSGETYEVKYVPGESETFMFGGNSNWRGPVWFPMNYLLIEALEQYDHFFGDSFEVEVPTGSGQRRSLGGAAREIARRLTLLFRREVDGGRPFEGPGAPLRGDPRWRDLTLFHEYFDGDTGRGLGASHQTGWTALVARLFEDLAAE